MYCKHLSAYLINDPLHQMQCARTPAGRRMGNYLRNRNYVYQTLCFSTQMLIALFCGLCIYTQSTLQPCHFYAAMEFAILRPKNFRMKNKMNRRLSKRQTRRIMKSWLVRLRLVHLHSIHDVQWQYSVPDGTHVRNSHLNLKAAHQIHPGLYLSYKFKMKGALSFLVIVDDYTGVQSLSCSALCTGQILCCYPSAPANCPDNVLFSHFQVDRLLAKHNVLCLADEGFASCARCIMNQSLRWSIETTFGRWKHHFLGFDFSHNPPLIHDCVAQWSAWLMNVKLLDRPVTRRRYPSINTMSIVMTNIHNQL